MKIKKTTEWFIERALLKHNNRYDYSKTIFNGVKTPVVIICSTHGEFLQTPSNHLYRGAGCPTCSRTVRPQHQPMDYLTFISKASVVHGNKYTYEKTSFVKMKQTIIVTCPVHGDFITTANNHLYRGAGCHKCAVEDNIKRHKYTQDQFIKKAQKIHNNKYNYSKTNYEHCRTPVTITCPIHGDFIQVPYYHLAGNGCQQCGVSPGVYCEGFFEKYPEKQNKEGTFYVIKININHNEIIKIGITTDLRARYPGLKKENIILLIEDSLYKCFLIEQFILNNKEIQKFKLINNDLNFIIKEGKTEMFTIDSVNELINLIDNFNQTF